MPLDDARQCLGVDMTHDGHGYRGGDEANGRADVAAGPAELVAAWAHVSRDTPNWYSREARHQLPWAEEQRRKNGSYSATRKLSVQPHPILPHFLMAAA